MRNGTQEETSKGNIILEYNKNSKIVKDYEIELKVSEKILYIYVKNKNSLILEFYYSNEDSLKKQLKNAFKDENIGINDIDAKISKSVIENIVKEKNQLKLILKIENEKFEVSFNSLIDYFYSNNKKIEIIIIIMAIFNLFLIILVLYLYLKKKPNCEIGNNDSSQINESHINDGYIKNINDLKETIQLLEINITDIKNKINDSNREINKTLYDNIIEMIYKTNNIENRIKEIEEKNDYVNNLNFQLVKTDLKSINTFTKNITKLKQFSSGNIISIFNNNTILISDNNFNVLQEIPYAHMNKIIDIDIFDDNNFVTISNDSVKTWIKNNDIFEENSTINNNYQIKQIIYKSTGNLISLSQEKYITIWEYNINNYRPIKNITVDNTYFLLLLEDKNILVSIGKEIIFFNLTNYIKIGNIIFNNSIGYYNSVGERISEDRIIIGRSADSDIISISQMKIIQEISILEYSYCFKSIYNKGIFLVSKFDEISIFRSDNFDFIQKIEKAHEERIEDIIYLKNETIVTLTGKEVKLWSL